MVSALLIPLPFAAVMVAALLSRNGRNRWLGYAGAFAGVVTLLLLWQPTDVELRWLTGVTLGTVSDSLALLMAAIVAGIGIFVFLYSAGYLEQTEDLKRYYFLLALFAASMLGAVLASNLVMLFMCWELVGVSSFLLIGFWHGKEGVVRSARKAFLTILVGDVLFLLGIFALFLEYRTFDIAAILGNLHASGLTVVGGLGLIGGAISKSAQFPLHGWLADAMAGPTPVSAFLHSATMVKLGLYVVARFLPLIAIAGLVPLVLLIALLTLLVSAGTALVETDVKRVLAYSTMNQLAFILLSLGIGAMAAGLFHLLVHSVFKALLFFVAGIAIHAAGTQDLRRVRLGRRSLLAACALVGVAALAGIPPLSGFVSKEAIFHAVLEAGRWELTLLFSLAIALSAAYIARWYLLLFHPKGSAAHAPWQMGLPLPLLALGALLGGLFIAPFFHVWDAHVPGLLHWSTILSMCLVGTGILLAWLSHEGKLQKLSQSLLAGTARVRFLVDDLYDASANLIVRTSTWCAEFENRVVNHSVRRLAAGCAQLGSGLRRLQTGVVTSSIAALLLGFVLLAMGVLA